ncbi:uncharacterized protein BX663DRAFT_574324, partial [Cokeromyces recurvatus]|uniref:uncharacterized protein n=1 Tax=Cokeromyces recurvatus TaxID=90255 RepID=UPI00221EA96A
VVIDSVVKNSIEVLPKHHQIINEIKKEGYQVIGYCRKSVGNTENRVSCLQRMIDILYKKSLVGKVLSTAKQMFPKRDVRDVNQILSQLNNAHGSTVDFLEFLNNSPKICVISIDYAGFTTNHTDLE